MSLVTIAVRSRGRLLGPSRHIAPPHELGRYSGKADVAFVASRGRIYEYTA